MSTSRFILLASIQLLTSLINATDTELQLVIELFRHGARRELSVLPRPSTQFPDPNTGLGDLTNTGYRAHYLLGRSIREKYADFLPEVFSQDQFTVYESNLNRTIESANSHLLGLFGLDKGEPLEFDNKDFYQPPIKDFNVSFDSKTSLPNGVQLIPSGVGYQNHNWVFGCDSDCPALSPKLTAQALEIQNKFNSTFAPLYETLINNNYDPRYYFGKPYYYIKDAHDMCDYIYSHIWNEPTKYDPLLKTQCEYLLAFDLFVIFSVAETRAVYLHNMLNIIKKALKDKSENNLNHLKMILLSGHDSNVAAFINLFKPDNYLCIAKEFVGLYPSSESNPVDLGAEKCIEPLLFTSNIIMELHKNTSTGVFEVRFLYNNNEIAFFENGSNKQGLKEFLGFLDKLTDIDYAAGCGIDTVESASKYSGALLVFTIIGILGVIAMICVFMMLRSQIKRKRLESEIDSYLESPLNL